MKRKRNKIFMIDTADVLKEMDAKHRRERKLDDEAHERSKEFVARVCNSGLVADVLPSGPPPLLQIICLGCNREVLGDGIMCPHCPPGTLQQFITV